jgi:hypothetical protein
MSSNRSALKEKIQRLTSEEAYHTLLNSLRKYTTPIDYLAFLKLFFTEANIMFTATGRDPLLEVLLEKKLLHQSDIFRLVIKELTGGNFAACLQQIVRYMPEEKFSAEQVRWIAEQHDLFPYNVDVEGMSFREKKDLTPGLPEASQYVADSIYYTEEELLAELEEAKSDLAMEQCLDNFQDCLDYYLRLINLYTIANPEKLSSIQSAFVQLLNQAISYARENGFASIVKNWEVLFPEQNEEKDIEVVFEFAKDASQEEKKFHRELCDGKPKQFHVFSKKPLLQTFFATQVNVEQGNDCADQTLKLTTARC